MPAWFIVYEADGLAKYACTKHHEAHTAIGLHSESLRCFLQRLYALDAALRLGAPSPPSEEEMLTALAGAALNGKTEAFFHGTIMRCIDCRRPVFGGPTRCAYCAAATE